MSRFELAALPLQGLFRVERRSIGDARGFLQRLFCPDELAAAGWRWPVRQINHTLTRQKGAVRGLHFQHPPHAEAKLVSCIRGEVWDVALDLRRGSGTFLRWHAERLSAENRCAMLIPPGFAHGFQALTDDAEMLYVHSEGHHADHEGGVSVNDPRVAITWPLEPVGLSARDSGFTPLTADYPGLAL